MRLIYIIHVIITINKLRIILHQILEAATTITYQLLIQIKQAIHHTGTTIVGQKTKILKQIKKRQKNNASCALNLLQDFTECDLQMNQNDVDELDVVAETVNTNRPTRNLPQDLEELRMKYLSTNDDLEVDRLCEELKGYTDQLLKSTDNVVTEKVSEEEFNIIENCDLIDTEKRTMVLTKEQATRLNNLNAETKELKVSQAWTWAAKDDKNRGKYTMDD